MIQVISASNAIQAGLYIGAPIAVCVVAEVAKKIFTAISLNSQNDKVNTLAGAAISTLLFSTCTPVGTLAIAVGIATFFLISAFTPKLPRLAQNPPIHENHPAAAAAADPVQLPPLVIANPNLAPAPWDNQSLQTLVTTHLQRKEVSWFIFHAIRKNKPEFVRQLNLFLFNLQKFQSEEKRDGLACYLQEELLRRLLYKPELFLEAFSPSCVELQAELLACIPRFYKDVAQLCAQFAAGIFDDQGRFQVQMIFDGNLINEMRDSPNLEIRRLGELAQRPDQELGGYDPLANILRNTPSFFDIDFTPLLNRLAFAEADQIP